MPRRFSITDQWRTVTKHPVLCWGWVGLSFFVLVGLGLVRRTIALENVLPARQASAAPTKAQPKLDARYGKLPLSFEANQGQADARVRFLARGSGYTIFLTDDEAVLALRKSEPGQLDMAQFGKFGLPGRLSPFGVFDFGAGRRPSLADGAKSPALISDLGQKGRGPNRGKGRMAGGPEFQPAQVMRMRLVGGNARGRVVGLDELPGRSNYFIGNDPKKWRTNVPSYARVKFEGVYPGVDLLFYGNQRQLEYDFVVAPGADPNQIKLSFAGADGLRVDTASGDLVLKTGNDEVRFHKPAVYQPAVAAVPSTPSPYGAPASGLDARYSSLVPLHASFVLASNNVVAFRVAGYDPQRALVIDPVLSYSSYLGGSGDDQGFGIAVDAAGNAYVTGETVSADFPTVNPFQANCDNCSSLTYDAFVTKVNPAGTRLVYSTYLGGSGKDVGLGITVDAAGSAYVTGETVSKDFPTVNPFQATNNATGLSTAFVAKLSSTGSALVYSTYLGGSGGEFGSGIAVDAAGNAYVTGTTSSTDFPTVAPIQTNCDNCSNESHDIFVAKLNPAGSALVYSTYLGGSSDDEGEGIAVGAAGNAYVTGETESTDFPTLNALEPNCDSCGDLLYDAFVAKLNPAGSALVYSTYLGGSSWDEGTAIAVGAAGDTYVTGWTSSDDFPTANPLQPQLKGAANAFVARLNPAGSALVYSTYLGGSDNDAASGIAVDIAGNAYVTGGTQSNDFPTVNAFQPTYGGGYATAFVTELNPTGSALVYSSYLGGSDWDRGYGLATDAVGNAYVTGFTYSTDFPRVNQIPGACKGTCGAGGQSADAFVARIAGTATPVVSVSPNTLPFPSQTVNTTSSAQSVTLSNTGGASLSIAGIAASANFGETDDCDGSVAASGTCTINVTFTPTATGLLNGSLTITDNNNGLTGSTQTVTLSGTGTAPGLSLSTTSISFSNQQVGTTSAASAVTVTNNGAASVSFTSITATGDFAVAASGTTCSTSTSVAASGSCVINVTFTPTATGSRSGILTLTDNASGSPQTVSLSGTGIQSSIAISSVNPSSVTLVPGGSVQAVTVNLTDTNYTGSVTLSTSALPTGVTATITQPGTGSSGSIMLQAGSSATLATNQTITITASGSGVSSVTSTFSLTVSAVPSIAISSVNPGSITLVQGGNSQAVTVNLTDTNYTGSVTLATSTLPTGVTATITQPGTGNSGSIALQAASTATQVSGQTITITASGSGVSSVTSTFSLTVGAVPSIAISSVSPGSVSLVPGGSSQAVTVNLIDTNYTGSVTLATSTLPSGVTATITQPGTGSSGIIALQAASNATLVTNQAITITASGSGVSSVTSTFSLTVSAVPSIAISSVSPGAVTLVQGGSSQAVTVNLTDTNYTGNVTLATSTLPTGVTATITQPGTGSSGSIVLQAAINATVATNQTITITASGSGVSSVTSNFSLTVAAGGPVVSLSASSLTFAAQVSGTPSSAQSVTLTNTGNSSLTIPNSGITASGDFSQTNTCGASVAAGANCSISVTFKPTAGGTRTGTLSISDNASGSPQSVALSGTGQDFSFAPPSGSSTSATVAPGSPATYTLSVGGEGGLSGAVNFTCTGAPSEATCTVSPNPVTAGSSATNVTVTVTTAAPSIGAPRSRPLPPAPPPLPGLRGLVMLALALAATAWVIMRRNQPGVGRWRSTIIPLALGLLLTLALVGCGGGGAGGTTTTSNPGTPAGTYNLTVTGSTGSGTSTLSHSVTLTLTVS